MTIGAILWLIGAAAFVCGFCLVVREWYKTDKIQPGAFLLLISAGVMETVRLILPR